MQFLQPTSKKQNGPLTFCGKTLASPVFYCHFLTILLYLMGFFSFLLQLINIHFQKEEEGKGPTGGKAQIHTVLSGDVFQEGSFLPPSSDENLHFPATDWLTSCHTAFWLVRTRDEGKRQPMGGKVCAGVRVTGKNDSSRVRKMQLCNGENKTYILLFYLLQRPVYG